MIGDIYLNTRTGKESIVTDIRGDQTHFAILDNPKRKFQLTEVQMSNMIKIGPPELETHPELPTLPEFLESV